MGEPDARRGGILEELKGLFGPAFGPALEAYGRTFAERISEDEGFRAEIRDRFERGRDLGGFPELSNLLAGMTCEERDEFFHTGWTHVALPSKPSSDPWDRAPWAGDREAYREDLYGGMAFAFTDLRAFAREWLEELLRVGYYGMEESLGLPVKQQAGDLSPNPGVLPLYGDHYPVRLEGTHQTVWLGLDGSRSKTGQYKEITVSEEPLRTDRAIFAALAMLEGRSLDLPTLHKVLPDLIPSSGESVWDRWVELLRDGRSASLLQTLQHHRALDFVLLLLRYGRVGFDALPTEDRAGLIADACAHLNEALEATGRLMAHIEYGAPGRRAVPVAKSISRDVKAALLKDVEGLTHRRIGEKLGIPPPADFGYKGDHPTIRKMVGRGRKFCRAALGEEGYAGHVQSLREEACRRHAMTGVERETEDLAEVFGIDHEEALRRRDEERNEGPGSA